MIKTYGVKYIGSKNKLNDFIIKMVKDHCPRVETAIDVFTGTTRVAQALRQQNIKTYTSDLSWASKCYANTFVHNKNNAYLQPLVDHFNAIKGHPGWLTDSYCDVIASGNVVRVWQPKNGMRADAIRDKIESLDLEVWERDTLITSLIMALDSVDNTVGVQQAYLKQWCTRSHKDFTMVLPPMMESVDSLPTASHFVGNALTIEYPTVDLAYLDPPYSPHSYSSYYHIWDSIAKWDKPKVGLKTNRRIDRVARTPEYDPSMESLWNRKNKALNAFELLIDRLPSKFVLISYNDESLVKKHNLINLCKSFGNVVIEEIDYTRNIMHKIGNLSDDTEVIGKNKEILILIEKD